MGYEISYSFHEKGENGYNKDETKVKKKKIGEPFEEIPLERLASEIIKLMARRDIFVFDFQIVELARKEVNFRETKGGIILKNKKFLFDDDNQIMVSEAIEQPASGSNLTVAGVAAPIQPHNQGQLRPIKYMVFSPELPMFTEIKNKGIRFTPDKKYPVFKIEYAPNGTEIFTMIDDVGRQQLISDKYFIPANIDLAHDREAKFSENAAKSNSVNLLWGNTVDDNMPNLRG